MIEAYYNWVHSIGLHLYTIPTILMTVIAAIIVAKAAKRNKDVRDETEED